MHSVSSNTPYGAGKYRFGRCQNKCFVETASPIRSLTTGNFEVDTSAFVCITLDTNNLPVRGYSTDWFNGGHPETWKENNIRYWAIGITATDNNNDSFASLTGGCQLLIEASRLV